MKKESQTERKKRTRTLIQIGGLVQKSGLMDAFSIEVGEDLQSYNALPKAAQLMGYSSTCFEEKVVSERTQKEWEKKGRWMLKR